MPLAKTNKGQDFLSIDMHKQAAETDLQLRQKTTQRGEGWPTVAPMCRPMGDNKREKREKGDMKRSKRKSERVQAKRVNEGVDGRGGNFKMLMLFLFQYNLVRCSSKQQCQEF